MTKLHVIMITVVSLALATFAQYKGGEVKNGGSISGVVKVKGKIPADPMLKVDKDQEFCGETMAAEYYVISAAGEVKNAVAMIEGIKAGAPLTAKEAFMDNVKCRNEPRVIIAPKGGMMKYRNSDPINHTAHYFLIGKGGKKKDIINQAMPRKGMEVKHKKILRKAGLISILCDPHTFEQGWIWSLEHPYGAVTNDKGTFKLENVPAGKHKVKIWHEKLGEKMIDVEVKAGQDTKITVEL